MSTHFKYAGFYPRLLAHNIDLAIMLPFLYLFSYFIESNRVLLFVCLLFYMIFHMAFELSAWKGTPGKKIQKIKIWSGESDPRVFQRIAIRNATKILAILLLFIGILMLIFDEKRRGLHDRLAGTTVIFEEN